MPLLFRRCAILSSCGVKAAHVLKLAFHNFAIRARGVQKVAVVTLDAYLRQVPRAAFAEEEQVAGPAIRQADASDVVELVVLPAQPDAKIVEGALDEAVAVHLRVAARRIGAQYVGHAQVLPAAPYYNGPGCHDAPSVKGLLPGRGPRPKRPGHLSVSYLSHEVHNAPRARPRYRSVKGSHRSWWRPQCLDRNAGLRIAGRLPRRNSRQRARVPDSERAGQDTPSKGMSPQ
jgi:hypothetical protein